MDVLYDYCHCLTQTMVYCPQKRKLKTQFERLEVYFSKPKVTFSSKV